MTEVRARPVAPRWALAVGLSLVALPALGFSIGHRRALASATAIVVVVALLGVLVLN